MTVGEMIFAVPLLISVIVFVAASLGVQAPRSEEDDESARQNRWTY